MTYIHPVEHLILEPPIGLSSPHIQTILSYISPTGSPPPSTQFIVNLDDGDRLSCEMSIPLSWTPIDRTIILVHGLAGSQDSPYMIRISRKLYEAGYKVIRVNLRGCGSGEQLAIRPYHGGLSADILSVVQAIHSETPLSLITLIGFSLGGNIVLKLAGELGEIAKPLIQMTIAVCPCVDLAQSSALLARKDNRFYNKYYLSTLGKQAKQWLLGRSFANLYEFDCLVTAPHWGFQGAFDYYQKCSSRFLLQHIDHPCRILFSADDPFINYKSSLELPLPDCVTIYLSQYGGHLGFLSKLGLGRQYYWMDQLLLKWIKEF